MEAKTYFSKGSHTSRSAKASSASESFSFFFCLDLSGVEDFQTSAVKGAQNVGSPTIGLYLPSDVNPLFKIGFRARFSPAVVPPGPDGDRAGFLQRFSSLATSLPAVEPLPLAAP